jgi:hypothetical protein
LSNESLNRLRSLDDSLSLLLLLGLFSLFGLDLLFLVGIVELLLEFFEAVHGDLGSGGDTGGELKGSSSEGNLASLASPDAAGSSLDLGLSAGRADVLGALLQLKFFDDLPDRRTVTSSVLSSDSHLLRSFSHTLIKIIINIYINFLSASLHDVVVLLAVVVLQPVLGSARVRLAVLLELTRLNQFLFALGVRTLLPLPGVGLAVHDHSLRLGNNSVVA